MLGQHVKTLYYYMINLALSSVRGKYVGSATSVLWFTGSETLQHVTYVDWSLTTKSRVHVSWDLEVYPASDWEPDHEEQGTRELG